MSRHEDDGAGREGLAHDSPDDRVIDRLMRQNIALRNERDELRRLYDRLRKITSYIPGRLLIEAKEKAGFGDNIKLM